MSGYYEIGDKKSVFSKVYFYGVTIPGMLLLFAQSLAVIVLWSKILYDYWLTSIALTMTPLVIAATSCSSILAGYYILYLILCALGLYIAVKTGVDDDDCFHTADTHRGILIFVAIYPLLFFFFVFVVLGIVLCIVTVVLMANGEGGGCENSGNCCSGGGGCDNTDSMLCCMGCWFLCNSNNNNSSRCCCVPTSKSEEDVIVVVDKKEHTIQ